MKSSGTPAVSIRDLRVFRGGNLVLPGITVEIEPGAVTGLLGPSGCGKTTLMRSIVGVQIVAGGKIEVLGRPAGSKDLRERVGYVTQAPSVYGDLSVAENLDYFARVVGVGSERVSETIRTVGLGDFRGQIVSSLSGGQRARVSLASALLNRPELLVLDEPTVGLDPLLRAELWKTFHSLADDGATLLVSSHVMDEASQCDRLILVREGRLLRYTTPEALRQETGEDDLGRAFLKVIESADEPAEPPAPSGAGSN